MSDRDPPLVGAPLFGGCLTSEHTHSNKAALATWLRVIAGNTRCLREHVTGVKVDDNSVVCAPKNARGLLGHDHSGVGFGTEIRHTYWAYCAPRRSVAPSLGNQYRLWLATGGSPTTVIGYDGEILVPVPAAYPGSKYDQAQVNWVAYCEAATASATGYLEVYSEVVGHSSDPVILSVSLASTGWKEDSDTIEMVPGKINRIRIKHYSTSSGVTQLDTTCLSISQVS